MSLKPFALVLALVVTSVVVPGTSYAQKSSQSVPKSLNAIQTQVVKIKTDSLVDGFGAVSKAMREPKLEAVLSLADGVLCLTFPQYRVASGSVKVGRFVVDSFFEATRVTGGVTIPSAGGSPQYKGSFFSTEFVIPDVEADQIDTNTVFGYEIRERRLTTTVKASCNVECKVNVDDIKIEYRTADKTWVAHLPKMQLNVSPVEDSACEWSFSYGFLRGEWCDKAAVALLKTSVLAQLPTKAAEEFNSGPQRTAMEAKLTDELKKLLTSGPQMDIKLEVKFAE